MNDRQLQSFLVTARSKSFSKAAEELYISPTALIQQINLLEEAIGFSLFHRTARGIRLTEAGESFYKTATDILRLYQEGIEKGRGIARSQKGLLRIGMAIEDISPFLMQLCNSFQKEYPHIRLEFVRSRFDCQIRDCARNLLDVFFFSDVNTLEENNLAFTPLYEDETYLVLAPDHPLASRTSVTIEDLEGETIYTEDIYEERNDSFYHIIKEKNLNIHIDNRRYDSSLLLELSLHGGMMPTPKSWLSNYIPPLQAIWLKGFPRFYGIVHPKKPTPSVQAFLQYSQNYFQQLSHVAEP